MSRFLRNKKFLLLSGGLLCALILLFTPLRLLSAIIVLGVLLYAVNYAVVRKLNKPFAALSSVREIKSYDTLVIGDLASPSVYIPYCNIGSSVVITAPDRSLDASFQILLHVISCIEEGGRCVIIHRNKIDGFSLFDTPFLHSITRKELHLDKLHGKIKWPIFYEPVNSMKILMNLYSCDYQESRCPMAELEDFCIRKGLKLIYLTRK